MSRKAIGRRSGNSSPVVLAPARARAALAAGVVGASLWALTAVAAGHPSFDEVAVPAESSERLVLSVPVESADDEVTNETIGLHLPAGFIGLGCVPTFGWTCEVDATDPGDVVVRWSDAGNFARPVTFEVYVRTPAAQRSYAFAVDQQRSDGSLVRWTDPPTGLHPAPRLRVAGPDTDPVPNQSPPPSHEPTSTTFDPPSPPTTRPGPDQAAPPTAPPTSAGPTGTTPTTAATGSSTTSPAARPGRTAPADIPEPGEADAVPPGGMALGLPDGDTGGAEGARLTPARIAVGLAAVFGALMTWLLLRRVNQPT